MNRLLKNASWIIVCKIIQSLLGFLISLMSARYLGPSNYGLINYAQSLVVFFTPITLLGFNDILVQEFIHRPEEEGLTLGTTMFFSFCSSLFCTICVVMFAFATSKGDIETVVVCAFFSLSLIAQAFELITYWYQAKLLSKYHAVVGLIAYTIVSIYKVVLLATGKNVFWFAISYAIDYTIVAISLIIIYKKKGGQRFHISKNLAKRLFRKSSPYILSSMMVAIFTQTDKVMLNQMLDSSATGYYSVAVMLGGITSFVYQAIVDSYRPKLFEDLKSGGNSKFDKGIVELYSILIYSALIQAFLMTLLAYPIVLITYGSKYMIAVNTLRIVSWFTTFSCLGIVRNIWILANEKQQYLTLINLSGAIANVVLNFILIPLFGINGAAIASLITQFFTNVIVSIFIRPIRYNNILIIRALNPAIAFRMLKIIVNEMHVRKTSKQNSL